MSEGAQDRLSADFIAAIRKEAIAQGAKWTVAAFAALAATAFAGWWLYLKPAFAQSLGAVPERAVLAFDLPNGCPSGWTLFEPASFALFSARL